MTPQTQVVLAELLRQVEKRAQPLAGVGLLSQPDMGTLQACFVVAGSPEHQDPELFVFANEWEDVEGVTVFADLEQLFLAELDPSEAPDAELVQARFGEFLDECCLTSLGLLRERHLPHILPEALFVYSRLDAADEEYLEWFGALNPPEQQAVLREVLGMEDS